MEGDYVCDECGERAADPVTLECRICDVAGERDRYRDAIVKAREIEAGAVRRLGWHLACEDGQHTYARSSHTIRDGYERQARSLLKAAGVLGLCEGLAAEVAA